MTGLRRVLPSNIRRIGTLAVGLMAVGTLITACSSTTPESATSTSTAVTEGPMPAKTTTTTVDPPVGKPTTSTTEVSVPLSAITDTGLPSKVGPGPLSPAKVEPLMQYFENQVAKDYADGDANGLQTYLAGSMLTGNKGTINVLNSQSRRNIYSIDVTKVIINNNESDRVVFEMKGNMTVDYFEDSTTKQAIADELPGPSAVDFLVFLDFNPANHTWYWTGEQNYDTTSGASSGST
jgi:hypothetical protein